MTTIESTETTVSRIRPEYEVREAKIVMPPAQMNLFTGKPEVIRFPVEAEFEEEQRYIEVEIPRLQAMVAERRKQYG